MSLTILPSLFGLASERKAVEQKRPLSILAYQSDEIFELYQAIVYTLTAHLPDSQAKGVLVPNLEQISHRLRTQWAIALLSRSSAIALNQSALPVLAKGHLPLRTLISLNDYLLVCPASFPTPYAYSVTAALSQHYADFAHVVEASSAAFATSPLLPLHAGTAAYYEGRPYPELTVRTRFQIPFASVSPALLALP